MKQVVSFLFLVSLISTASAAQQIFTIQPSMMPEMAKSGEYKVGVQTLSAVNKKQLSLTNFTLSENRKLTFEVWYPAAQDDVSKLAIYENVTRSHTPFQIQGEAYRDAPLLEGKTSPLVVLSHGYTGYRTIMYYLGEHLASHGYIVVGIDHTGSTNQEIDFADNPGAGFVSTLLNRARDQQFVLDYFSSQASPFIAITNAQDASVIGYSMGGFGALNTVGGCYEFTSAGLQRLGFPEASAKSMLPVFNFCAAGRKAPDPRWKAMVAMAPWGQELNVHAPSSLAKIAIPTLYVAGDQDDIVGFDKGVKRLYEQTGSEHNYMLVYENARHNFAPHPAPIEAYDSDLDLGHYVEPAWDSEKLTRINEHMILAFLDCHIKQQATACKMLPIREIATQIKQSDGKLTPAWPGFPDRWGAGIRFIRADGQAE